MASEKQIAANRANAKCSTGPKSKEGKVRASKNSLKHGLSAKTIPNGGDAKRFDQLHQSLIVEFSPCPGIKEELVRGFATSLWRLLRVAESEASVLRTRQREIVRRDPRLEKLIEDEIRDETGFYKITAPYLKRANRPVAEKDKSEIERSIRKRFEEELPPLPKPVLSSAEKIDALLNICRHETALLNIASRKLDMLLQAGRHETQEANPRESRDARKVADRAQRIVIDGEEPADFEKLHKAVVQEFRPRSAAEQELAFLIATFLWRLRRIPGFEADFLIQQTDGVYRDPRVDRLVEDRALLEKFRHEMADRFSDAHTKPQRERATELGDAASELRNEQVTGKSAEDSGDLEQRVRNRYGQLLPPQCNQPALSPAENQEALFKIARYESSLIKSLCATRKLLFLLVNRRGTEAGL